MARVKVWNKNIMNMLRYYKMTSEKLDVIRIWKLKSVHFLFEKGGKEWTTTAKRILQ